jgi:hypothetical protein
MVVVTAVAAMVAVETVAAEAGVGFEAGDRVVATEVVMGAMVAKVEAAPAAAMKAVSEDEEGLVEHQVECRVEARAAEE